MKGNNNKFDDAFRRLNGSREWRLDWIPTLTSQAYNDIAGLTVTPNAGSLNALHANYPQ